MNMQFIQSVLLDMKTKRIVGKPGLPATDVRIYQTKIRQTEAEDFALRATANCMVETPAQLANAAMKLGLVYLLAEDDEVYQNLKARAKHMGYQLPDYLKAVDMVREFGPMSLERFNRIIEGEFELIEPQKGD